MSGTCRVVSCLASNPSGNSIRRLEFSLVGVMPCYLLVLVHAIPVFRYARGRVLEIPRKREIRELLLGQVGVAYN